MFNESIKNSLTISIDSWYTDCKVVNDRLEFQTVIGSAQNANSPKFSIAAHQIAKRIGVHNKNINIAIFDNLDVRKNFIEIDGQRYPEDSGNNNSAENGDPKFPYREYVGEGLLNPYISFACMKIFYLFQVIDLKHQVDHFTLKKIQLFQDCRVDPNNARMFVKLRYYH